MASSRLSELPDGRFAYDMKRALPDGRKQLVMTGVELLEKLVPIIPPTYANLTRFHGVFALTSRLRAQVVPRPPTGDGTETPPCAISEATASSSPEPTPKSPSKSPSVRSTYRLDWAALLKRVFAGARRRRTCPARQWRAPIRAKPALTRSALSDKFKYVASRQVFESSI